MIGGIVIEVYYKDTRVFINCRDTRYKQTCAIYVERDSFSERVEIGDMIWWQGKTAFHTPAANRLSEKESKRKGHKQGTHFEIPLRRAGYSFLVP